jgi:hypothetical protein
MKCLLAFVDTSNTSLFVFLYGCYLCAQRRDAMQVSDCLFDHSALYIHIESTYKNKSQIRPSALSPRTAILKSTQLTFEVGWRNTTPVAFRHSLSSTSLPSTATRHTIQSTTQPRLDSTMCTIKATRYTTCGCVKDFIPRSIIRCRDYQLHKYTRCNGHLGSVQTVSHQGGVCARHPDVGEQLPPEMMVAAELGREM